MTRIPASAGRPSLATPPSSPARAAAGERSTATGTNRARLAVGTSGWHYLHWRGVLYGAHESPCDFLASYARRFRAVEVNATFYRLPDADTVARWRRSVGDGFVFVAKAHRAITHRLRLAGAQASTRRFLESLEGLGELLEVVLVQLPPQLEHDADRLAAFLAELPPGRPRVAVEFRHPSWYRASVFRLLERHGAALCVHDHVAARSPARATAPFAYVRLHGGVGPDAGRYGEVGLRPWARRIRRWRGAGLDVYAFFNNDAHGHAVRDAETLAAMLSGDEIVSTPAPPAAAGASRPGPARR